MKPEEEARRVIDDQLVRAGWTIQDYDKHNLAASSGVAIREFPIGLDSADYLLFVDRKAVGVIEAKPIGTTLGGVSGQTLKYLSNLPDNIPKVNNPLPFSYESTGSETFFRDLRDPDSRSRRVFSFYQPKTLGEWASQDKTLRARLKDFPPLQKEGLRECQYQAITNLERSFADSRTRALIQMATGSGKTYTAVNFCYRLIKYSGARRILFLVDRNNLGRQTFREFQQFSTPDDRRKFTELYNVQHLTSNRPDPVSRVCISTIQRVYSMLSGRELEAESEEASLFEQKMGEEPLTVGYNPAFPIEYFDFVITDECHRSIYHLWRQVLEYFDSFIIGLTATPSKQTFGFFNQNLVMEYSHEKAVADGVNVGYDVYRIKTEITEKGSRVESGFYVDKRDRLTRIRRIEQLDEALEYDDSALDRSVVAVDQIRTVIRTFKEKVISEIFPDRQNVPKTIIFAKDDSHAEDILHIVREEFGKGNDFCKKITYRTTGEKPEDLIQSFRISFNPRIVVSVDMISTGTDIRPVECLLFMRDVKSQVYFEQMKGRGSRVISREELQQASGSDALYKDHFVIVDAVGVCESDKTDSRPLERKHGVGFEALLNQFSFGSADDDSVISLAGRLSRLDRKLTDEQRQEIKERTGFSLKELSRSLFISVDADVRTERAKQLYDVDEPDEKQVAEAAKVLVAEACEPFVSNIVRETIIDVKMRNEQIIDEISKDVVTHAGYYSGANERARTSVKAFEDYLEAHKDELTALQFIYAKPYSYRKLTYREIRELADALIRASPEFTAERLWSAYRQLESSKVRGAGPARLLTDIVSLVRFAVGSDEVLEPYPEVVNRRFNEWMERQKNSGKLFTNEQIQWLEDINNHIGASANIEIDDFENVPFNRKGGTVKAFQLFGSELSPLLDELNVVLNS